jgi:hypothetical protein
MANNPTASGAHAKNNVVSLLDCVRKDDRTSLIFEFVEGRNFIDDLPKFTELDVARYMRELFIALAHVHRYHKCACLVSFTRHSCSGLKLSTVTSNRTTSCALTCLSFGLHALK